MNIRPGNEKDKTRKPRKPFAFKNVRANVKAERALSPNMKKDIEKLVQLQNKAAAEKKFDEEYYLAAVKGSKNLADYFAEMRRKKFVAGAILVPGIGTGLLTNPESSPTVGTVFGYRTPKILVTMKKQIPTAQLEGIIEDDNSLWKQSQYTEHGPFMSRGKGDLKNITKNRGDEAYNFIIPRWERILKQLNKDGYGKFYPAIYEKNNKKYFNVRIITPEGKEGVFQTNVLANVTTLDLLDGLENPDLENKKEEEIDAFYDRIVGRLSQVKDAIYEEVAETGFFIPYSIARFNTDFDRENMEKGKIYPSIYQGADGKSYVSYSVLSFEDKKTIQFNSSIRVPDPLPTTPEELDKLKIEIFKVMKASDNAHCLDELRPRSKGCTIEKMIIKMTDRDTRIRSNPHLPTEFTTSNGNIRINIPDVRDANHIHTQALPIPLDPSVLDAEKTEKKEEKIEQIKPIDDSLKEGEYIRWSLKGVLGIGQPAFLDCQTKNPQGKLDLSDLESIICTNAINTKLSFWNLLDSASDQAYLAREHQFVPLVAYNHHIGEGTHIPFSAESTRFFHGLRMIADLIPDEVGSLTAYIESQKVPYQNRYNLLTRPEGAKLAAKKILTVNTLRRAIRQEYELLDFEGIAFLTEWLPEEETQKYGTAEIFYLKKLIVQEKNRQEASILKDLKELDEMRFCPKPIKELYKKFKTNQKDKEINAHETLEEYKYNPAFKNLIFKLQKSLAICDSTKDIYLALERRFKANDHVDEENRTVLMEFDELLNKLENKSYLARSAQLINEVKNALKIMKVELLFLDLSEGAPSGVTHNRVNRLNKILLKNRLYDWVALIDNKRGVWGQIKYLDENLAAEKGMKNKLQHRPFIKLPCSDLSTEDQECYKFPDQFLADQKKWETLEKVAGYKGYNPNPAGLGYGLVKQAIEALELDKEIKALEVLEQKDSLSEFQKTDLSDKRKNKNDLWERIEYFIKEGICDFTWKVNGKNLIHYVIEADQVSTLKLLIEKKANVNVLTTDNKYPLEMARELNLTAIIGCLKEQNAKEYETQKLLENNDWRGLIELSESNPEAPGIGDAFLRACINNRFDYAKTMIANKIKDIHWYLVDGDYAGWNSLHWAIYYKNKDMVELLLSKGVNVNFKLRDYKTAIQLALQLQNAQPEDKTMGEIVGDLRSYNAIEPSKDVKKTQQAIQEEAKTHQIKSASQGESPTDDAVVGPPITPVVREKSPGRNGVFGEQNRQNNNNPPNNNNNNNSHFRLPGFGRRS